MVRLTSSIVGGQKKSKFQEWKDVDNFRLSLGFGLLTTGRLGQGAASHVFTRFRREAHMARILHRHGEAQCPVFRLWINVGSPFWRRD